MKLFLARRAVHAQATGLGHRWQVTSELASPGHRGSAGMSAWRSRDIFALYATLSEGHRAGECRLLPTDRPTMSEGIKKVHHEISIEGPERIGFEFWLAEAPGPSD